jgi:hypothetical protein
MPGMFSKQMRDGHMLKGGKRRVFYNFTVGCASDMVCQDALHPVCIFTIHGQWWDRLDHRSTGFARGDFIGLSLSLIRFPINLPFTGCGRGATQGFIYLCEEGFSCGLTTT